MTTPDRRRVADEVIAVRVADETVAWHRVTGKLNLLDPIATQVFERLDGRTTDEVVADLCSAFGAPSVVVQLDVQALLAELSDLGVLGPVA